MITISKSFLFVETERHLLSTPHKFFFISFKNCMLQVNGRAHPIIGIVVTALTLINPIMALFRPHPGTPRRPIFNWAHWFVGTSARILAIVAIFLGKFFSFRYLAVIGLSHFCEALA